MVNGVRTSSRQLSVDHYPSTNIGFPPEPKPTPSALGPRPHRLPHALEVREGYRAGVDGDQRSVSVPAASDLHVLGNLQRVVHLHAEVPHRGFQLGVPEQKLHCPQILRLSVDEGRLRPAQRVGSVVARVCPDQGHPSRNQARILARGQVAVPVGPTEEEEIPAGEVGLPDPGLHRVARLRCQLEADGLSGLLLDHLGPGENLLPVGDVSDTQPHQVTAAQLAVDPEVEEGEIPDSAGDLQPDADLPDLSEREGALLPRQPALVPGNRDARLRGL